MGLRKYRWSRAYESAEEELLELLQSQKIEAERWTADGDEAFESHVHSLDKKLWCAEGSIVFIVDAKNYSLQPGDALDVPAFATHRAVAGFSGCVCYESPKVNPVVSIS